ncbi:hypothetical protein pb186bvf_005812 [Paramecium bursaria]
MKKIFENFLILNLGDGILHIILQLTLIIQRIKVIRQTKSLPLLQSLFHDIYFIDFKQGSLSKKGLFQTFLKAYFLYCLVSFFINLKHSIKQSQTEPQEQQKQQPQSHPQIELQQYPQPQPLPPQLQSQPSSQPQQSFLINFDVKQNNTCSKIESPEDLKQNASFENNQMRQFKYEIECYKQIDLLYQQSFKQRVIEDQNLRLHIRQIAQKEEIFNYYDIDDHLQGVLNFIPVRGDGNCFFTSMGFQYILYGMNNFQILLEKVELTKFNYVDEKNHASILNNNLLNRCFREHLEYIYESRSENNYLKVIQDKINDQESSFYGLLIIFMRNLFYEVASDQQNEEAFLIQNRENVHRILEWEHMFDETEALLRLFSVKEQIIIKVISKLNIDDKEFRVQQYNNENQNVGGKIIYGLTFQPGHYNAVIYNNK